MNTEIPPVTPAQMASSRVDWRAAVLLLASSFLILFLVSLQYFWPSRWWGSPETMAWKGDSLTLVKGRGHGAHGILTINGLDEPGAALASLAQPPFHAENYPVVHWAIKSARPDMQLEFLWRTAENPGRVFARKLEWQGNSMAPLSMVGDANWQGRITGMALMVRAPLDSPVTIEDVKLLPFSPLGVVWHEWFGIEPWLGTSINFVGENESRQWVAPLPFVAIALGLALVGYGVLVWRKGLVPDVRMLWLLVFLAWLALDLRWQVDLWGKLVLTNRHYAGKSWEEKHLAAEDGHLFGLMQQVRAKLPPTPARIFLFANEEYLRGRGAYHLYPFNVLNSPDLLPAGQFRSGDFIIILGKDEVEFDLALHLLKWGAGQQLSAELLLLVENNVLLKVR